MRTKTILITFLLTAFAIVAAIVMFLRKSGAESPVSAALPPHALWVVESNGTGPIWQKLRLQTKFWPAVASTDEVKRFENQLALLDTLLGSKSTAFYHEMASRPMAFAVYPQQEGYSGLLVTSTGNSIHAYELREMAERQFGQRIQFVERKIGRAKVFLLIDKLQDLQFHFALHEGLFIGGFNKQLVENAVHQLGLQDGMMSDSSFHLLQKTKGTQVDAHLLLDYKHLAVLSSNWTAEKYRTMPASAITALADKALLDVVVKQNELLLSGFSLPTTDAFSQALAAQKPREVSLMKVLPYNTHMMLLMGAADFDSFYKLWMTEERLQQLNRRYGLDFGSQFIPLLNEIGLAMRLQAGKQERFFVAKTDNVVALSGFLKQLSSNSNGRFSATIPLKGFASTGDLVGELFGQAFAGVKEFHYLMLDQYLLVADNASLLDEIEIHYRRGRTLDQNENFMQFANNLADASNVLLYLNLRDGFDLIQPMIDNKLGYFFNRNIRQVRDFEAVAVQFTAINQLLYTSFVLKYNPDYKEESLVGWRTQLQAPMIARPFIIEDHASPNKMVVAFDATNNMYLIDSDGQVQWRKQLKESPISDVYTVDYYKNGKLQYLFNTATHLYLIDRNGNDVANYPVKLRSRATNGLTLLDYEKKKDYRILISCADKITYNYEISGKEVQGWMKPRSSEIVTRPVEHLAAGKTDYIIITDSRGELRIVDRRGMPRISPRGELRKSKHADFYINKTNSKGVLLTTERSGRLLYISAAGLLSTTDFGTYSEDHFFLYEDFTQNRSLDFIYMDGNTLQIFDRFKKSQFNYSFKNPIHTAPVFFNIKPGKRLLGVVDEIAREIYLIDRDGKITIGSGLQGATPFAVGSLRSNDEINLLTGLEDQLINYQIY